MTDESLEQQRKKRLEAKKAEEQLKTTLRTALDEEAYRRLMNVSIVNKQLYLTAARNALMIFKKVDRKITERELLSLLKAIKEQTEKKQNITFHRK